MNFNFSIFRLENFYLFCWCFSTTTTAAAPTKTCYFGEVFFFYFAFNILPRFLIKNVKNPKASHSKKYIWEIKIVKQTMILMYLDLDMFSIIYLKRWG